MFVTNYGMIKHAIIINKHILGLEDSGCLDFSVQGHLMDIVNKVEMNWEINKNYAKNMGTRKLKNQWEIDKNYVGENPDKLSQSRDFQGNLWNPRNFERNWEIRENLEVEKVRLEDGFEEEEKICERCEKQGLINSLNRNRFEAWSTKETRDHCK